MPVRIYDIAKRLGLENSEVLNKAKELGIAAAKVAASSINSVDAETLEKKLKKMLVEQRGRGLRSLQLGNFKAFGDTQSVPIRPITLIFGANSAGKSSILHGLLLARQAMESGELDISRTEIGGDSVDLGGFRQYVHRRDLSRHVEWAAELNGNRLRGQARQILEKEAAVKVTVTFGVPLDGNFEPSPNAKPWLLAYEIESAGRVIVRVSRRPDNTVQLDRLDQEILQSLIDGVLIAHTTTERLDPVTDMMTVKKAVEELISTLRFSVDGFLPGRLVGEEFRTNSPVHFMPIPKGDRVEQLVAAAKLFIPRAIGELIQGVNTALREQLECVCYLGPLRSFPPRHLAFSDDRGRNWMAGGGYAWDLVRTNIAVRMYVNDWLGADFLSTRYQMQIRTLGAMDAMEEPLADAIEQLPIEVVEEGYGPGHSQDGREYDGETPRYGVKDPQAEAKALLKHLRDQIGEKYEELVLLDLRTNTPVTHRDVGIGISQVLPVLVNAFANEGKIIAIEQPEIHLHPALQAELGDVFIEFALGDRKNTFLLETHSEHLILRIMRRIRETHQKKLPKDAIPITNKDVCILYVEPDGARSIIREMPLNEMGELVKAWPGGFFEEGLKEMFP